MPLSDEEVESVSQAIVKELAEADRWIQARLDNFFPLMGQIADENPAWLAPDYIDVKLREHGLPRLPDGREGDALYLRVADRVAELATQANGSAPRPACGERQVTPGANS